jgi:threonine/homoserine/homoserine lactone efflux protein
MARQSSYLQTYLRGAALHFTNPKAIFVWLSTVTLALPAKAAPGDTLVVIAGCWIIGCAVFGGYAIAFSTSWARAAYRRAGKWLDGGLAFIFGYAGVRMLVSGITRA